jgi:UDP-GlcNAc3NAcA epimerase
LTLRIVTVVGARPQFVKAFPLSRAFAAASDFDEVMIHTGQHFDTNMSQIFFSELGIPKPKHHFDIHGGTHGAMTGKMLEAIEHVLIAERPDAVVVFGDTDSTLAGALAAAKLYIPLVHVEAGLRSFNRQMPEEINRIVADHVSRVLIAPTSVAVTNLAREGITAGVHKTGDLMYDATLLARDLAARHSTIVRDLGLASQRYAVATVHRAQNTDDPQALAQIVDYLATDARRRTVVFPLHPRTRKAAQAAKVDLRRPGLAVIDPVGYLDMVQLLSGAASVFTDSGGMQKEAYFHRVPCVTLRGETEWVETVEAGWNRLWTGAAYRPRRDIAEYGDGNTAAAILGILRKELGRTKACAAPPDPLDAAKAGGKKF